MKPAGSGQRERKLHDAAYWAAFEFERARVLRRRTSWCLIGMLALLALSGWGTYLEYEEAASGKGPPIDMVIASALDDIVLWCMLVATLVYVRIGAPQRQRLVRTITIATIAIATAATYFEIRRSLQWQTDWLGEPVFGKDPRVWACRYALFTHTLIIWMSIFIVPMRLGESVRIWAWCTLAYVALAGLAAEASGLTIAAYGSLAALTPLPAMLFSHWRYQRFDAQFRHDDLAGRFGELSAELEQARRLHEGILPKRLRHGPVQLRYVYEPMREIGGDFLFVPEPDEDTPANAAAPVYVVLIDVSGHGVPAALAVNRLHGELTRLFGVRGRAGGRGPSAREIIRDLNDYVWLTLARQGVFATGLCFRIESNPKGGAGSGGSVRVEWCNAGHPPAFLRSRTGEVHRLGATSTMLGVVEGEQFECESRHIDLVAGETIVAYTDGLHETRDQAGQLLGLEIIEAIVKQGAARMDEALVQAASRHRWGRATDDTLVVEIGLTDDRPAHKPDAAHARASAG